MDELLPRLKDYSRNHIPAVLITVAVAKGSTPREQGAKMLVSLEQSTGTIGGGNLEYKAIATAREMLHDQHSLQAVMHSYPLGPSLGQCCGGHVYLLFEPLDFTQQPPWLVELQQFKDEGALLMITPVGDVKAEKTLCRAQQLQDSELSPLIRKNAQILIAQSEKTCEIVKEEAGVEYLLEKIVRNKTPLYLFGAGHVGKAIVAASADLPFQITWIDEREAEFPDLLPDNVRVISEEQPSYEVSSAPPGAFYLVLTHDHQLDLEISEKILQRGDFGYFGLIGSESKKSRFLNRFRQKQISEEAISRMTCPIGIPEISSKHASQVAISVVAQLLIRNNQLSSGV